MCGDFQIGIAGIRERLVMGKPIKKLTIEGFKSIRKLEDFELRSLNVMIGANGAGKSNFVGFFRLLRELIEQRLQLALATEGGADACLFMGPKVTQQVAAKLFFGNNGYQFALKPTVDNRLVFAGEATSFNGAYGPSLRSLGSGHTEAKLKDFKDEHGRTARHGVPYYVFDAVSSWVVWSSTTFTTRVQRPVFVVRAQSTIMSRFGPTLKIWRLFYTGFVTLTLIRTQESATWCV